MRNYFKTLFMVWPFTVSPGPGAGRSYAWGGNDASLLTQVLKYEQLWRQLYAPQQVTFHRTTPVVIWWELDKENFLIMLNGGIGSQQAIDYFGGTRIGDINQSTLYYDMTVIGGVQPSPRRKWSHGH